MNIDYKVYVDGVKNNDVIPGSLLRRKNGAAEFTFDVPNPDNRNGNLFDVGTVIKYYGRFSNDVADEDKATFVGFVHPNGGLAYSYKDDVPIINCSAVDFMGILAYERILVNETQSSALHVNGKELSSAIKDIISTATHTNSTTTTKLYTSGIEPPSNPIYIDDDSNISSNFGTKLSVINNIRKLYADTSVYPDPPLRLNFVVRGQTFCLEKEENLNSTPNKVTYVIDFTDRSQNVVLSAPVKVRPRFNRTFGISSEDSSIQALHQDSSRVKEWGFRFDDVVEVPSVNRGDVKDRAVQNTLLNTDNQVEFELTGLYLHHLHPTDVVQIKNSRKFNIESGYYQVEEVKINAQTLRTSVVLSNVRPVGRIS